MSIRSTFRPVPDLKFAVIVDQAEQCMGCGNTAFATPDGNHYLYRWRLGAGLYCSRSCQRQSRVLVKIDMHHVKEVE